MKNRLQFRYCTKIFQDKEEIKEHVGNLFNKSNSPLKPALVGEPLVLFYRNEEEEEENNPNAILAIGRPSDGEEYFLIDAAGLEKSIKILDSEFESLADLPELLEQEKNERISGDTMLEAMIVDINDALYEIITRMCRNIGLNDDGDDIGTYEPTAHDNTQYISGATSLTNADVLLDAAIWNNRIEYIHGIDEVINSAVTMFNNLSLSVNSAFTDVKRDVAIISGDVNTIKNEIADINDTINNLDAIVEDEMNSFKVTVRQIDGKLDSVVVSAPDVSAVTRGYVSSAYTELRAYTDTKVNSAFTYTTNLFQSANTRIDSAFTYTDTKVNSAFTYTTNLFQSANTRIDSAFTTTNTLVNSAFTYTNTLVDSAFTYTTNLFQSANTRIDSAFTTTNTLVNSAFTYTNLKIDSAYTYVNTIGDDVLEEAKAYADEKVTGLYKIAGSVSYYDELATLSETAKRGDVYNVENAFVWTGNSGETKYYPAGSNWVYVAEDYPAVGHWDPLGGQTYDMSLYLGVSAFTEFSGTVKSEINRLDQKIDAVSSRTTTLINNLSGGTVNEINNLKNASNSAFTAINNLKQTVNEFSSSTVNQFNSMSGDTNALFNSLSSATFNTINNLSAGTQNEINNLSANTYNTINTLSSATFNTINNLSAGTVNSISNLSANTYNTINDLSSVTFTTISNLSAGTKNEINNLSAVTSNKFDNVYNVLSAFSATTCEIIGDISEINYTGDNYVDIYNNPQRIISISGHVLTNPNYVLALQEEDKGKYLVDAYTVKQLVNGVVSALTQQLNDVTTALAQQISGLTTQLQELSGNTYNTIQNLKNEVIQDINSATSQTNIYESVANIISGTGNEIKVVSDNNTKKVTIGFADEAYFIGLPEDTLL